MTTDEKLHTALKLQQAGKLEEAESLYREILRIQADNPNALHYLGLLLYKRKENNLAIQCIKRVIELYPTYIEAYSNLGLILQESGLLDEAITYLQKAIQINPGFALAYYNLGDIYREKGCFDEAIICYQKTLQLDPNFASAYNNMGLALQEKGRIEEAIICYKKTSQLDPDYPYAHLNLACAFLLTGNFTEGWKEYEWRLETEDSADRKQHFPQPFWDGSSLEGKILLVYAEQGIGDEIMFASCLPEIIAQADLCIVECDKRLVPLFMRSFTKASVTERAKSVRGFPKDLPAPDVKIAIGSLPMFLRPNPGSFPQQEAYLVTDSRKVEAWRARMAELGDGLRIGISWKGGSRPEIIRARSMHIEQWRKLFSIKGVHFINLQYGDCSSELRDAKEKMGVTIHDWEDSDPLKDLDNFAAQISALDLVISVDNATVHMAGALGVPVWVLLPFVPDWRWMMNREDSPWYPAIRLFRQPSIGDWESVITRIAKELHEYS